MKVILLRDVAKIGRRGQVIEVPDGYALNQLIPKKLAEAATPANLKKITNIQATTAAHDSAEEAQFIAVASALSDVSLQVITEANEKGHLFRAINEQDIVTSAKEKGLIVDTKYILIANPIKSLGKHSVELRRGTKRFSFVIDVIRKS